MEIIKLWSVQYLPIDIDVKKTITYLLVLKSLQQSFYPIPFTFLGNQRVLFQFFSQPHLSIITVDCKELKMEDLKFNLCIHIEDNYGDNGIDSLVYDRLVKNFKGLLLLYGFKDLHNIYACKLLHQLKYDGILKLKHDDYAVAVMIR